MPAPPKLAELVKHSVVTLEDVGRIDDAFAQWFQRFQAALEMNSQGLRTIDGGLASLGRTRIQLRRGVAADWTSVNPILADGELGVELDTGKGKLGNGTSQWTTLPYSFLG